MKNKFLSAIRNVFCVGLVVAWAMVIFFLSGENKEASSLRNEEIVENLTPYYYSALVQAGDKLEDTFNVKLSDVVNTFVRKGAHVAVYAVLGFLGMLAMCITRCGLFTKFSVTSNFCLLYAISDELHQMFIPGRSCSVLDVCFDYIGSLGGISVFCVLLGICYLVRRCFRPKAKSTILHENCEPENQQIFHSYNDKN
ncbi:MAG: VanZ family protein [Oscillospiraceae bacterium]|nr:VanZ family protein [Oscillospiraceae bacterium]